MTELTADERSVLQDCISYLLDEDGDSPYPDWLEGHGISLGADEADPRPAMYSAAKKLAQTKAELDE